MSVKNLVSIAGMDLIYPTVTREIEWWTRTAQNFLQERGQYGPRMANQITALRRSARQKLRGRLELKLHCGRGW